MYNEPIGQVLSQARQKLGKSTKEIELDTKIRSKYIEALENDDFSVLPGYIYAKGFIKTYANYLGIEAEPLVQQYKNLYEEKTDITITKVPTSVRVKKKLRPSWFKFAVVFGVFAVAFVGLITWGAIVKNVAKEDNVIVQDIKTRRTPTVTAVAGTTASTNAKKNSGIKDETSNTHKNGDSEESDTKEISDSKTKEQDKISFIKLRVKGVGSDGSWVKITVDGEVQFVDVIKDGTTKLFKGEESIGIRIGKPDGVTLTLNDKKVEVSELEPVKGIIDKTFTAKDITEDKSGER